MNTLDLSIGQRLALGFGAVIVVVMVAILLMFRWHAESAAAQQEYTGRIVPARARTEAVERGIYQASIAVRTVLAEPAPEQVDTFRASVARVRALVQALNEQRMQPDGRELAVRVSSAADAYIQFAEGAVGRRLAGGEFDQADRDSLTLLREAVLAETSALGELEEQKAAGALEMIGAIRDRTASGLAVLAVAALLLLLLFGWLTSQAVSGPARRLLAAAGALRAGDWQPALALAPTGENGTQEPRDELRRLAHGIGTAAVALDRREQRLRADRAIARTVSSTLEREALCAQALRDVVRHLDAPAGVVYTLAKDARVLRPIATHALGPDLPDVAVGEGIPGQVARDRQPVLVTDIPRDSGLTVKLGYDQTPPRTVAAIPLVFGDELHGVLLVASLRELDADAMDYLEATATQLGVGLNNVAAYEDVERLLDDVRASNERVQAQNEELQAQSEQLQVQHEEIQAQNEELLQQSDELRRHTATLAEEDANKNRFLGILAHELRNPMTPIVNSLHIIKRSAPGDDASRRSLAVIERQVAHLVRLIDDLLDVTRISQGKIIVQRRPVDLREVVRACADDLYGSFERAGVELELDLPEAPLAIHGDGMRLAQVIGNLLSNSIKFCDKGSVQVALRVATDTPEAVLTVRDDGIGMDGELMARLFQPFSQGTAGIERANGGLGLGLALVKALVDLHGGEVAAYSDGPGRGAEFTVRLPLADAAADLEALASEPGGPGMAAAQVPWRILVIEDNVDAAQSLREAFALEQHEVAVAHTGLAGLEQACAAPPDIVLCDIGLPELDGYEVARRLRADPRTQSLLLIALTGYASAADRDRTLAAGFDMHLTKPLDVAAFRETVAKLGRL